MTTGEPPTVAPPDFPSVAWADQLVDVAASVANSIEVRTDGRVHAQRETSELDVGVGDLGLRLPNGQKVASVRGRVVSVRVPRWARIAWSWEASQIDGMRGLVSVGGPLAWKPGTQAAALSEAMWRMLAESEERRRAFIALRELDDQHEAMWAMIEAWVKHDAEPR